MNPPVTTTPPTPRRAAPRGHRAGPAASGLLALLLAASACAPRPAAPPAPSRSALAAALAGMDTLRVEEVAPGVVHAYAWDARGPWAIHVLEADRSRCLTLEARKAGPPLAERARTSALAADALAGVNADFFGIPAGTPIGADVSAGEVLIGPGERPIFAVSGRRLWIGRAALSGTVSRGGGDVAIVQVNRAARATDTTGLVLFTRWYGQASPAESAGVAVAVRRRSGSETAGGGVVAREDTLGGSLPLDSTVVVLTGRGAAGRWLRGLRPGDTVTWRAAVVPAGGGAPDLAAREAVGGHPVLLRDGRVAAETDSAMHTAFGKRNPRTALGIADGGRRVLLVTVDGRQKPYSDGMTLVELADLLRRLGAEDALNLDGGGSTAMVVEGRVVNRPSDKQGERPVGNVLAVRGGACAG